MGWFCPVESKGTGPGKAECHFTMSAICVPGVIYDIISSR